jgi:pyridoxamine 5'-phosphate oxidase-like protein
VTQQIRDAIRTHNQWFGSYKRSGELVKVQVWLTVPQGDIEFLTGADSYKAKRVRRNPRVICFLGAPDGPSVQGTAEIVTDRPQLWRIYRAYWGTHPLMMIPLGPLIAARILTGKQVGVRVKIDPPNPLDGITDPEV